jgi:1,4-dihydroxy-2-naphthoyl-CoA hydrolase
MEQETSFGCLRDLTASRGWPRTILIPVRNFQRQKTIGFGDADAAGVIFYPRLLALAHEAVEDLIRQAPGGWEAWFASTAHAVPIRRAEVDCFRPMRPGQTFVVRAAVDEIGTTSVVFIVEFLDEAGPCAARARTVHVFVAKTTGRPAAIPEEIRAALR